MNWNELSAKIGEMTPEEREREVLMFDDNEGEFDVVEGVNKWDDKDSSIHGTLYLE